MRRGTTPVHPFTLPFDIPDGSCVRIVYAQNKKIVLEKTAEDCSISGSRVSVRLTSDETLRFDCSNHYFHGRYRSYPAQIQIGVETPNGDKVWSEIIEVPVEPCLREDGVI